MSIVQFTGQYRFLSNFWLDGLTPGASVEHRFQASKTFDADQRTLILNAISPGKAKTMGRKVTLRPDWELVRVKVMQDLVEAKFQQPDLRDLLEATGDEYIMEGNTWNDTFWGVDLASGYGDNRLGCILMRVRNNNRERV